MSLSHVYVLSKHNVIVENKVTFLTTPVNPPRPRIPIQTPPISLSLQVGMRKPRVRTPSQFRLSSRHFFRASFPRCTYSVFPSQSASTNVTESPNFERPKPFYLESGMSLFAKRPSRPFPPPFLSPPSGSFSDPLSTHHMSRDRRSYVNGEIIRGATNGDDAALTSENFVGVSDGVGAWATRPKGHAA
jgi:hypothetical protein